jgi:hypothetical protein
MLRICICGIIKKSEVYEVCLIYTLFRRGHNQSLMNIIFSAHSNAHIHLLQYCNDDCCLIVIQAFFQVRANEQIN